MVVDGDVISVGPFPVSARSVSPRTGERFRVRVDCPDAEVIRETPRSVDRNSGQNFRAKVQYVYIAERDRPSPNARFLGVLILDSRTIQQPPGAEIGRAHV